MEQIRRECVFLPQQAVSVNVHLHVVFAGYVKNKRIWYFALNAFLGNNGQT